MLVLRLNIAFHFWKNFSKSLRGFTVYISSQLRYFLGAVMKTLAMVSHKYSECSVCTRKENQLCLDLAWICSPG